MIELCRFLLALTAYVVILLGIVGVVVVFGIIDVRFRLMIDLRIVNIIVTFAVIATAAHGRKPSRSLFVAHLTFQLNFFLVLFSLLIS